MMLKPAIVLTRLRSPRRVAAVAARPQARPQTFLKPAEIGANGVALLDLLRAVGANLVLFGHTADVFGIAHTVSLGQIGVGIFFILSGFLIFQSSLKRIQEPQPYFAPYMIDRFARIFTAYIPALIFVAALNAAVNLGDWGQPGLSHGPLAFLGNLFLLQDYPLFQLGHRAFGDGLFIRTYNAAEPFWTIPIEFWIYVLFGLGFFGLVARERLKRPLWIVLGAVALPVVLWNVAAGGGNGLTLVWVVGAMGAYIWVRASRRIENKAQIGLVIVGASLVCIAGRGIKTGWNFQDLGIVLCEAALVLGLLSLMQGIPSLPRVVRKSCTLLASYSYSLYLIHNTVLILVWHLSSGAPTPAALAAAFIAMHAAAIVLYLAFERHHRQVAHWLKRRLDLRQRFA